MTNKKISRFPFQASYLFQTKKRDNSTGSPRLISFLIVFQVGLIGDPFG